MRLYSTEEKKLSRVNWLRDELARCKFEPEDCPLLVSQLNEAAVIVARLEGAIGELQMALRSKAP